MHDYKARSTILAAQEALKSAERLRKTKTDLLKRPKIVAVDMDGTILNSKDGEQLGDPISGVKKKLDRFKTMGWVVVIWTVREETPEIIAHLKKHEIPFDYFNWHPWQPKGTSAKLKADVYIDDRAVAFTGKPEDYDQVLVHKPWWRKKKDA
jgi:hypothetical protein